MKKRTDYQTKNRAYTSGRTISVKGVVLHSYGTPQPDPNVLVGRWNSPNVSTCVHAHAGKDEVIVTLPCEEKKGKAARGWHAGSGKKGSANDTHLSLEMTEPATIKYTNGSSWIELGDGSNTKAHVLATYKSAVEIFAQWCTLHGLDPISDGVILSHSEAHARGIASNHGDVEHIWKHFGLSMGQFRKDVKADMQGNKVDFGGAVAVTDTSDQQVNPLQGTVSVIYKGEDGLNIRKAPSYSAEVLEIVYAGTEFAVIGISLDEKWYKLSDGGFISAVPDYVSFKATAAQKESTAGTGYYRVRETWDKPNTQIGAFKVSENAVELCKQNSGYRVYDPHGKEIYPCADCQDIPMQVVVKIPNLRIRKGPGTTFDYHKQNGKAVYVGKGKATIVETSDGPGAKLWGLLPGYAKNRDGWIALDAEYVESN